MSQRADTAHLFASGHTACAGCGQSLGARLVLRAAGPSVITTDATGCLEIFSSNYPASAWEVPWIHSLFENSAAVASGIEAALRITGRLDSVRVIAQGGDGATADIGFGALSGMWERGHDVLYVCYDNEAYMNTGIQRSGLTPTYSSTTTSPPGRVSWGNPKPKKDLPQIAVAHGVPYVATATVGYPHDLDRKVKKALSIRGPKYIQIHVPCPLGWRHDTSLTIAIAKLAVQTGLYPLIEYVDGNLASVRKITKKAPVEEYLRPQGRFAHLFRPGGEAQIAQFQGVADANIERYGLMPQGSREVAAPPPPREMTRDELATCDGREGRPAYVAYQGKVYDLSGSGSWPSGLHHGEHQAGQDLTEALSRAPHEDDVLSSFPVAAELRGHPHDDKA